MPMARAPSLAPRDQVADDDPLRLDVAAALEYPDGTKRKGGQITPGRIAAYGTVDWPLSRAIVETIDRS
jgi:hypothetical protein